MLEVERPGAERAWRASSRRRARSPGRPGPASAFATRGRSASRRATRWACGSATPPAEAALGLTGHSAAAPILFDLVGALPAGGWFDAARRRARGRRRVRAQRHARRAVLRDAAGELVPRPGSTLPPAASAASCTPTRAAGGRCTATARRWRRSGPSRGSSCPRRWRPTTAASTPTTARLRLPARLPRGARRRGERLALSFVYPREGVDRLRAGGDGRARWPRRLRRRPTATRGARLLAPRRRVPGRDARHPPDGARPAPGPHVLVLVDERGETIAPSLHRRGETGAVLLRFRAGL